MSDGIPGMAPPARTRPQLSDETLYRHERQLLKMFLMSVLVEGGAISDRMGILTWSNNHDTEGVEPDVLCLVYRSYKDDGAIKVQKLAPLHVSYETLIEAAVDSVVSRNEGDFSYIVVHETTQSDSPGITWDWIRKQTMVPASICLRNPIARFVQRQNQRVAEAADAHDRDARLASAENPKGPETNDDSIH